MSNINYCQDCKYFSCRGESRCLNEKARQDYVTKTRESFISCSLARLRFTKGVEVKEQASCPEFKIKELVKMEDNNEEEKMSISARKLADIAVEFVMERYDKIRCACDDNKTCIGCRIKKEAMGWRWDRIE